MAKEWNGTIAVQTDHFRGTSTVDIRVTSREFSNLRAITGAVYVLRVDGGVSGSFGATVLGRVGGFAGSTVQLAGVTAIGAAGTFVMAPYGYGAVSGVGTLANLADPVPRTIVDVVPPCHVAFQSGIATVGISASCTVSASLTGP